MQGGVDRVAGVASHPPFACSFVHDNIGVVLSLIVCQPTPILFNVVKYW